MNDIQSLQNHIDELTKRVKYLEDNRFTFPIKLGEIEKKSINNVMFLTGFGTLDGAGEVILSYPQISPDMVVVNNRGLLSYIRTGTITQQNEIFIGGGTPGDEVNFIVFLTTNGAQVN